MLSRGNRRATVFHGDADYADFVSLLDEARQHHAVDLLAFCLMPNHFHLVVRYEEPKELSALMQWWLTIHTRRHHLRFGTTGLGHVWQDRFKSFPIQADVHLLTVLRYVLRNPVRAKLVDTPWAWQWSSLWFDRMLAPWPVEPPGSLREWLDLPMDADEDHEVSKSVRRSAPFGDEGWKLETARAGGLEATLRPQGRPKAQRNLQDPETRFLF